MYFDVDGLINRFLRGRRPLFDARIAAGRVCDGHGDLLADDIFCTRDGPRVLDCIEFDDQLRWTDTLADVAFLAMDLERLGRSDLARRFLDHYAVAAGDDWAASLEHQYVAHRAAVRAKVACLRHGQGDDTAAARAGALIAMAWAHLRTGRVRLVLVGGPPGTGKSTIARGIAAETSWTVIRSDVVRKELAGMAAHADAHAALDHDLYSLPFTTRTYEALLDRAGEALESGLSVLLDASWSDPGWRRRAGDLAANTSSELIALQCDAPAAVALERVDARAHARDDASDADTAIAAVMRERFAPWPDARVIDTATTRDKSIAAALHVVR